MEAQEAIDEDHLDNDELWDFLTGTLSEYIDSCRYRHEGLQNEHCANYTQTHLFQFVNKINFLILTPRT